MRVLTTHYTLSTPTAAQVPFIDACAAPGHNEVLAAADDVAVPCSVKIASGGSKQKAASRCRERNESSLAS